MFNMGGPIKQGIMHGIREPYKHGGPTGTGLVGDQRYPKTDGREHHLAFIPPILAGIATAARVAAPWALRAFGTTTPASITRGAKFLGRSKAGKAALKKLRKEDPNIAGPFQQVNITPEKFNPNWLGRDPLVQSLGWAGKTLTSGPAKSIAGKAVQFGTAPSTLIGGLWFANGRWFNKKGKELDPDSAEVATAKAKGGGKDYGPYKKGPPTITASAREAKAKADKEKRINDLLDTMGYDKARKNAAYDALIDAGRMVSERGTLDPKNIGRELIDPIVAATSARFDKPQQIREAVGLMKVKADIAKDMSAEKDALDKLYKQTQIAGAQKALEGDTLEDTASALFTRHGSWPSGEKLANLARNKGITITEVVDTSTEATGLKDIGDPVDFMESKVQELREGGTEIPPGNYVVDDAIIIIDSEGNVSRR